jgi:hypothetical protein
MAWLGAWTGSVVCVLALILRNERLMLVIVRGFMKKDRGRRPGSASGGRQATPGDC